MALSEFIRFVRAVARAPSYYFSPSISSINSSKLSLLYDLASSSSKKAESVKEEEKPVEEVQTEEKPAEEEKPAH